MTDLMPTIIAKSDQLNADDLIGGRTLTIKVVKVSLCGEPDQPVAVHYEGDAGKPYKPCKSMRRVMVNVWGPDGNAYAGRRMTLYRDDKVTFGKEAVGGIRISHMSDIDRDVTMALTATRASRKPYTVRPLRPEAESRAPPAARAATNSAPDLDGPIDHDSPAEWLVDARRWIADAPDVATVKTLNKQWDETGRWLALRAHSATDHADLISDMKARIKEIEAAK